MTAPLSSSEKLAQALEELMPAVSLKMIERARRGYYRDFGSPLELPKVELVDELKDLGHTALATRVTVGEFNDTVTESRQYLRSMEFFREVLRPAFPGVGLEQWRGILGGTTG